MIPAPRRYLLCISSTAAISLLVVATHGQTLSPRGSARTLLSNFAPPAVQQGLNPDTSHWPGSPEMRERRAGPQMLAASERVNAFGTRYMGDRVIVKFRDGITAASRASALSAVTPRGSMAPRSAWQNFDVVEIAGTDDAEAVAASYRARADVEYAQAAYRVQADQASTDRFVPNDRFYPAQWNLQLMGLERVWKIQPAAASAITVAVLDTGVAFADRTMEFTAGAFCVDSARNVQRGSCPGGGGSRSILRSVWSRSPSRTRPNSNRSPASSRHTTSSGTTTCRSIWVITARTSPVRSVNSPTTERVRATRPMAEARPAWRSTSS